MDNLETSAAQLAANMRSTADFLAEWTEKPGYNVYKTSEAKNSNYIVVYHGTLVLWARTFDSRQAQLFVHTRADLVAKLGEDEISRIEEGFRGKLSTIH